MIRIQTRSRRTLTALLSSLALVGGLAAASAPASAYPIFPKFPGPKLPFPLPKPLPPISKGGPTWGYPGLAFGGALAIGAMAATMADDCYTVRRVVVDQDGNDYVRRFRVCD